MDALGPLLEQISLSARIFYTGQLCQLSNFDALEGVGHLHLLKSGRLSMQVRGKVIKVIDRPSVILLPRPNTHTLVPLDLEGADLVCASIDLGARNRSPIAVALPDSIVLPIDELKNLGPTLDLLFAEAFDARNGRQAAIDRLAEYFLIQVLRHIIETGELGGGVLAAIADRRLSLAVAAMHRNPAHSWSLEELADVAGMSRARFAVNFRNVTGITPHKYLTEWRISVAQNLLRQGKSLKNVATEVGYGNPAGLSRVFAQYLGTSPGAWQRAASLYLDGVVPRHAPGI